MHNTGTEYLSTERKPHVLDELASLLPDWRHHHLFK